MKTHLLAGFSASFLSIVAACSGSTEAEPRRDPPVTVAPDPLPDAGPRPDARPPGPTSCSGPIVDPKCASESPPPSSKAAIDAFVKANAIPLRCEGEGEGAEPVWDLHPLVDLYGSQKMFMIGEVHGTNEIGIVSSMLFEQLASKKLVNVVAFEMPMDLEEPFQHYVDTGKDPAAEQFLKQMAPNFFGTILTKTARELAAKGIPLRVGAVDIPYSPYIAVEAIQQLATKLGTQKDTVLGTLPTSASEPPTADDITKVNAYFDLVMSKKTAICAELSEADCDRLDAMTHALWASTLAYDRGGDSAEWFARREVVIYYNLRTKMAAPTDRMFLHMGAFHTNKHLASAGSRMAQEYAPTKGRVFSVAPAYGNGSVIWYGQDMDLPGEPTTILSALSDTPKHPFFVPTNRPSATCEGNPLGREDEENVGTGGKRGELYDGYIHYGRLTSERKPTQSTLARGDVVGGDAFGAYGSFRAFRDRIEARERDAIASGALGRLRR